MRAVSDAGGAGSPAGSGQVLAGRYRLVRQLAEGGMAVVWEGRDEILARTVAIKVPHARLAVDPAFRERFRREAVAAARLAHPGIVATYDTGVDGATDFIVMELVPGRTVRELVASGPVPAGLAIHLAAQVAEALDVAHRAGIIHRDIKPANLLLVEDGPTPRVKVADFGVAWAQETFDRDEARNDLTQEGLVVGTARYLAPEQVTAGTLDGRTDVYAVGCVLYELLTGQPPFVRETDLATALAQMAEPALPLSARGISVAPELERVVLSCLAKDPNARPSSALDLAQQLRALPSPAPRTTTLTHLATTLGGPASPPVTLPPPAPATVALPIVTKPKTAAGQVPVPGRSPAPLIVVASLVVTALITALVVVTRPTNGGGNTTPSTGTTAPSTRAGVAGLRSFDPEGDGQENDAQLPRLIDGNPATTWSTDRYNLRAVFGGLKTGVGVVLVLDGPTRLGQLRVRSASQKWAAQVYVADAAASTLAGWGQPVTDSTVDQGDLAADLRGARGAAVLVWFTDPGPTGQVVVSEVEVGTR